MANQFHHPGINTIMRARLSSVSSSAGFTLLELAIVLTLFGVIIASVWLYSGQAYSRARERQTEQQITAILANIQRVFANTSTAATSADVTTGDITASGITAGVFPAEMIDNNTTPATVLNAMNGATNLQSAACGSGTCIFVGTQVPQDACASLLLKFVSNAAVRQKFGIISYAWGGANQPTSPVTLAAGTNLTVANVATACTSATLPANGLGWLNIYTNR